MRLIDWYQTVTLPTDVAGERLAKSRRMGRGRQARAQQLAGEVARRRNRRAVANASRRRNRG